MKSDLRDVEAIYQVATQKALCVRVDETSKDDIWIPLSLCEFEAKEGLPRRGKIVVVTASETLLIEKGLL